MHSIYTWRVSGAVRLVRCSIDRLQGVTASLTSVSSSLMKFDDYQAPSLRDREYVKSTAIAIGFDFLQSRAGYGVSSKVS
jgi:hypothetical protein